MWERVWCLLLGPTGWPGAYFGRIALSPSDSGDQHTLFLLGEAGHLGGGLTLNPCFPDSFRLSWCPESLSFQGRAASLANPWILGEGMGTRSQGWSFAEVTQAATHTCPRSLP